MKVCLYLEFYHFAGGFLFKKIGTGLLSSYKNQKAILAQAGIPFIERWDSTCDILQINTPWLKSLYLIRKAHRQGKKVIIWSHITPEDAQQVFRVMILIAPLFRRYIVHAYNQADIIFSPSAYTKTLLVQHGIAPEKIIVHSNAVNTKKYYADATLRRTGREKYGQGDVRIGSMGLVIPRKGIDTFLKLAGQFPQTSFTWFGKIYSSIMVKPLPKKLPANVRFTGYVPDINEAYNSLDVFIFPSYEENEGMVILEAASAGLPILVRDIPTYNGWLVHGTNCLKAKNDEEFNSCLKQLLSDPALRQKLGAGAKKLAQEKSIENIASHIGEEYQRIVSR